MFTWVESKSQYAPVNDDEHLYERRWDVMHINPLENFWFPTEEPGGVKPARVRHYTLPGEAFAGEAGPPPSGGRGPAGRWRSVNGPRGGGTNWFMVLDCVVNSPPPPSGDRERHKPRPGSLAGAAWAGSQPYKCVCTCVCLCSDPRLLSTASAAWCRSTWRRETNWLLTKSSIRKSVSGRFSRHILGDMIVEEHPAKIKPYFCRHS